MTVCRACGERHVQDLLASLPRVVQDMVENSGQGDVVALPDGIKGIGRVFGVNGGKEQVGLSGEAEAPANEFARYRGAVLWIRGAGVCRTKVCAGQLLDRGTLEFLHSSKLMSLVRQQTLARRQQQGPLTV